jgi:hypothetical protein
LFTGFVKVMLLSYRNPGLAAVLVRDFDMLSRVFNIANSYKNDLKQDAESARLRLVKRLDAEPQLVSALRDNEEFPVARHGADTDKQARNSRRDWWLVPTISDHSGCCENSALMHLKSYEIDGQLLRTGAANFSVRLAGL